MAAEGPRHAVITADDHGALLAMATWFLTCTLVLCTATRLIVRFTTRHVPGIDDALVVVAAALSIGSAIAISLAVNNGLGRRLYLLGAFSLSQIQKEIYAATILYILAVGMSKISMSWFLARLAGEAVHKVAVVILSSVVVAWTIAVTFGFAFQCKLPRPWDVHGGKCISIMAFWIGAAIIDIATDIVMIALPIHIVWNLQLGFREKATVCFIFVIRLILIIVSILRLVYLPGLFTSDPTFDSIPYGIATQCHSTLSVIIACTPALKPFIDNVKSGMLDMSLAPHATGTTFGQSSFNMHPLSKNSEGSATHAKPVPEPQPSRNKRHRNSLSIQSQESSHRYVLVRNSVGRIIRKSVADVEFEDSTKLPASSATQSALRPHTPPETELVSGSQHPESSLWRPQTRGTDPCSLDADKDIVMTRFSYGSAESQKRITWESGSPVEGHEGYGRT